MHSMIYDHDSILRNSFFTYFLLNQVCWHVRQALAKSIAAANREIKYDA